MNKVETLLSQDKLNVLIACVSHVANIEGDISEVGVYLGGSALAISQHSGNKKIYLFDTFEGIPMKSEYDKHDIGDFSEASFENVSSLFKDNKNVLVVKGLFPESATSIIEDETKFSLVHLDADQYESTKKSLNYFYNKMSVGGIIVCDDYGWDGCPGVPKAIHEFLCDKPETIITAVPCQCYIIKK